MINEYELYHDESQIEGYWHGMLLVPTHKKQAFIDCLQRVRENTGFDAPIGIKNVSRKGKIFNCAQGWITIANAFLRSKTKNTPLEIYFGERINGRKVYELANNGMSDVKFILFSERDNLQDMTGHKDHASKVETTFRIGLKGGLHFLADQEAPIKITKIHFDGHEHYKRHIDKSRAINRISGLRDYCEILDSEELIDDRSSKPNKTDSQDYNDCQLLQMTDLLIGSFRSVLRPPTKPIHRELAYPMKQLIERYRKGYARMSNSRWHKSFCMSQCYLENGSWVFDTLDCEVQIPQLQMELPIEY